jgi:CheY-like chemotaxis protein
MVAKSGVHTESDGLSLRLDLSPPEATAVPPRARSTPAPTGAIVLVVDDEADVRRVLARTLQRAGYRVVEADSAEAALATVEQQAVDLVLTDLQMPGMGGIGLIRELRARGTPLARRLVVCTGSGELLADLDGAGEPPEILAKPCSVSELLGIVRRALER